MMGHYTKNQNTLDAMLVCHASHVGVGDLDEFIVMGDSVADVMRSHCCWVISVSEVQEVSENVWRRFKDAAS